MLKSAFYFILEKFMQYINTALSGELINKTLANTYKLLAATLVFSGVMAYAAMAINAPYMGLWTLLGYFGLLFLVYKTQNSAYGILSVFALTGFMGFTLGPILNYFLATSAGTAIVVQSLVGTGVAFFALSFYAVVSKKDFSFLSGFLTVGIIVAFIAMLANIFLAIPALSLTISVAFILLMSGLILFETSNIVRGGETNYILATVSLYVAIYNIFLSLLQILGVMGDE
jgi:modulator of FtsH protease